jgi:hypothetical protein
MAIDRMIIKPTLSYTEIIQVKVFAASGTFNVYYTDTSNVLKIMTLSVGATAAQFYSTLANLPNLYNYQPNVTMTTLDIFGNPSSTSIEGYQYRIGFSITRPNKTLPSVNGTLVQRTVNKSITVSTLTDQMSGTFQIFINGTQLSYKTNPNFPYSPNLA